MQAEKGDGLARRVDGWMDGCRDREEVWERELKTGKDGERFRKHSVAFFYHGKTAPASFFHSPPRLWGFFKQQPSKHASLHFESHQLFCGKASLNFSPF